MTSNRLRIMSIVGARPNMMKVAPLMAEMRRHEDIQPILVHTGQHYDYSMSQVFFDQLRMPVPAGQPRALRARWDRRWRRCESSSFGCGR